MEETLSLHVIARVRSDFTSKFGIPRQSNLVPEQEAVIVFEPEYRDENALRGLECYSHQHPHGGLRHPLPLSA